MPELLALPFSPWSEKARWALDVRHVPYAYRVYQPILGEPALRRKLRRAGGNVTVPVLTTDDGRVLGDSADIARWADARGDGPSLFPAAHEAAIARFIDLSERALEAGRALTLTRMLADDDALAEMVPRPLRSLRALAVAIGGAGIRRTLRKYADGEADLAARRRTLTEALDEIRSTLAARANANANANASASASANDKPQPLLGQFTFADIAATQAIVAVEPPAFGLKLRPASRRCWTDPDLRSRYGDLVAWRDAIYETFRPRSPSWVSGTRLRPAPRP